MKNGHGRNANGQSVTLDTGIGDPSKANREKGEKFFNEVVLKLCDLITDLSDADIHNMYE